MRNISRLWQGNGRFGLVAGLASSTSGAIRNARPEGAVRVEVLTCAAPGVSNKQISQRSLAAKALTQEQYRSELEKLGVLDRAKDFDGVVRVANDLNNRWGQSGGQYYGLLMLEIGNLLENHFSREGTFAVSQKYVSDALAKSETFPLWSKMNTRNTSDLAAYRNLVLLIANKQTDGHHDQMHACKV